MQRHVKTTLCVERCSLCGTAEADTECIPGGLHEFLELELEAEAELIDDPGIPARWTGREVDYGEPGGSEIEDIELHVGCWTGDTTGLTKAEFARLEGDLWEAFEDACVDRDDDDDDDDDGERRHCVIATGDW